MVPNRLHSSSEETSQRWRAVGDTSSNLTGPEIEPQTSSTDKDVVTPTSADFFEFLKNNISLIKIFFSECLEIYNCATCTIDVNLTSSENWSFVQILTQ